MRSNSSGRMSSERGAKKARRAKGLIRRKAPLP